MIKIQHEMVQFLNELYWQQGQMQTDNSCQAKKLYKNSVKKVSKHREKCQIAPILILEQNTQIDVLKVYYFLRF